MEKKVCHTLIGFLEIRCCNENSIYFVNFSGRDMFQKFENTFERILKVFYILVGFFVRKNDEGLIER